MYVVDFEQMLIQNKIDDDGADDVPPEILRSRLKEKITFSECLKKGYVLTGFPRTRNDFEWLDSLEMAPNRVIFLAIDFRDLCERSKNRPVDNTTGTVTSLDQAAEKLLSGVLKFEEHMDLYPLSSHQSVSDFKNYCDRLQEMLHYCGNDCSIVLADGSLVDKISECITSGSPAVDSPRPQNRMPSRLTDTLNEKMFPSYKTSATSVCPMTSKIVKNTLKRTTA